MSKEEKAKEYAKVACLDIVRHYNVFTKEEISKFTTTDYLAGYTQAEQDLSTQLTAVKEALREIIKECEEWVVPGAENSNNCENNHYVEIDDLKSLITKAKTLIE